MRRSALPLRFAGLCLGVLCLFSLAGCIGPNAFWSPNGKAIALDFDGRLRLFNVASGKFARVDTGARTVVNPTFSPDGRRLAYYGVVRTDTVERADLWVRDLETNREWKIVDRAAAETSRPGVREDPTMPA